MVTPEVDPQQPVLCACCYDRIKFEHANEIQKESFIGPVCESCKHNFKIACAYLKHYGMSPCSAKEEREINP